MDSRHKLSENIKSPVYRQDIEQFVQRFDGGLTTSYRFQDRQPLSSEPLLDGLFETHALNGLFLHRVDARDLSDRMTESALQPGLKAVFLCAGNTDVVYGRHRYLLGNRRQNNGRVFNEGALVSYAEPDLFKRHWRQGRTERKISLTLTPEWLDRHFRDAEAAPLQKFLRHHMATVPWQPSAQALNLARQMLAPVQFSAGMQRLYLEARSYDLALEVIGTIVQSHETGSQYASHNLTAREIHQVNRLTELLGCKQVNGMSLHEILRMAGIGSSRIHRNFRQVHSLSIFGYLHRQRMQKAYTALQKEGVNVGEAAQLAGYSSAANFSTAFKKEFGMTPRQAWPKT